MASQAYVNVILSIPINALIIEYSYRVLSVLIDLITISTGIFFFCPLLSDMVAYYVMLALVAYVATLGFQRAQTARIKSFLNYKIAIHVKI